MASVPQLESALQAHVRSYLASTYGGRTAEVVDVLVMLRDGVVPATGRGPQAETIGVGVQRVDVNPRNNRAYGPRALSGVATLAVQVTSNDRDRAVNLASDLFHGLDLDRMTIPDEGQTLLQAQSFDRLPANDYGYEITLECEVVLGRPVWELPDPDRAVVGVPGGPRVEFPISHITVEVGELEETYETGLMPTRDRAFSSAFSDGFQ